MSADFALERFERVDTSARTALLRVRGRWSEPEALPRALIVGGRRFAPLPEPRVDGADEAWRGAYPVPMTLLDAPGVTFALEDGPALPAPVAAGTPMEAGGVGTDSGVSDLERERDRALAAYRDARHEIEQLHRQLARETAAAEQRGAQLERHEAARQSEADELRQAFEEQLASQESRAAQETQELLQLARDEAEALREAELADLHDQRVESAAEADAIARARDEAVAEAERRRQGERRLEHARAAAEEARRVAEARAGEARRTLEVQAVAIAEVESLRGRLDEQRASARAAQEELGSMRAELEEALAREAGPEAEDLTEALRSELAAANEAALEHESRVVEAGARALMLEAEVERLHGDLAAATAAHEEAVARPARDSDDERAILAALVEELEIGVGEAATESADLAERARSSASAIAAERERCASALRALETARAEHEQLTQALAETRAAAADAQALRSELDAALARADAAEEKAEAAAERASGSSVASPGGLAEPPEDFGSVAAPTRRRWRRGAGEDEPGGELVAEPNGRAEAEARADQAELRLSEIEGRMLELEFARAVAQERADELAARLPDADPDERPVG